MWTLLGGIQVIVVTIQCVKHQFSYLHHRHFAKMDTDDDQELALGFCIFCISWLWSMPMVAYRVIIALLGDLYEGVVQARLCSRVARLCTHHCLTHFFYIFFGFSSLLPSWLKYDSLCATFLFNFWGNGPGKIVFGTASYFALYPPLPDTFLLLLLWFLITATVMAQVWFSIYNL